MARWLPYHREAWKSTPCAAIGEELTARWSPLCAVLLNSPMPSFALQVRLWWNQCLDTLSMAAPASLLVLPSRSFLGC